MCFIIVIEEDLAELPVSELLHRANKGIVPEPDEPKLLDDIAVNEKNADPCTSYNCLWPKYSDGNIWVPYVIANHYSPASVSSLVEMRETTSALSPAVDMKYNFNKINTLNQGTPYDYTSVMQYEKYAFSMNGYPTMVPIPNNNVQLGGATQMSQNDITRLNRLYKCFYNKIKFHFVLYAAEKTAQKMDQVQLIATACMSSCSVKAAGFGVCAVRIVCVAPAECFGESGGIKPLRCRKQRGHCNVPVPSGVPVSFEPVPSGLQVCSKAPGSRPEPATIVQQGDLTRPHSPRR
ncbi:Low choriolytic enzyme [Triplophysa tibetana]|uniref:Metalloendopeptidase n=1 Tax=Triplophysa tibetana TaxID=1572043 RepID=A0A5A9PMR2_9TELE|nr:Low choriolytic enzyme [Triplophysa tibetana]